MRNDNSISMKVLQVNAVDNILSTGTIMSDIQDVCTRNGIDCYIAYCSSRRDKKDIYLGYHIGTWFDHKMHALLSRIFQKQAYFSTIPTLRFSKYIKQVKPDVVHLHNLHNNYINLNLLLRFLSTQRIPVVITLHDNWFYTGGCTYYPRFGCNKWQTDGCVNCSHLSRLGIMAPTNRVLKDRSRYLNALYKLVLVGVSDWASSECRRSVIGDNVVRTVRNGVRTDVFLPIDESVRNIIRKRFSLEPKQFVILGPATKWLDSRNNDGLMLFIQQLKSDEVFVIMGCSEIQIQHYSLALPQDKVRLLPFIINKVVLSTIYGMADLFVNCTYEDTCSFINIESQACGTPILTFDNTGAAETVDGFCSFRVPTGDYKKMAEVKEVVKNQIKDKGRNYFENACREWVCSRFDMRKNYDQYIQIYKELAGADS